MKKPLAKSIWSIFTGFLFVVIISTIMDLVLEKTDIMLQPFDLNSNWFIIFVIVYRSVFAITGTYITAKLAPNNPMKHALIGGVIGFILSIIGAVAMWHIPPHWYAISLIITALPCAWLGGKLFLLKGKVS